MKRKMNLRLILALDGLALLAIIGAVQVCRWACSLMAVALAGWGGWDITEAAQAAPWILFALVAGLGMSLYGMHKDNEYYSQQSYGRIERNHARNPEYPQDEEKGA